MGNQPVYIYVWGWGEFGSCMGSSHDCFTLRASRFEDLKELIIVGQRRGERDAAARRVDKECRVYYK